MKNYLDLLDIDNTVIDISVTLEPIVDNGAPNIKVLINSNQCYLGTLTEKTVINKTVPLLDTIAITIDLFDKQYSDKLETAVIISSISVDTHEIVNRYDIPISYSNDQHVDYQGFYLGFNGSWNLSINEPFYRWLHRVQGHGWILEPAC